MKNLIRYTAIILSVFTTSAVLGQYGGSCTSDDIKNHFLNTTLLVPEMKSEELNIALKKGLEKYWKITDYEIVSEVTHEQANSENYSILQDVSMTVETSQSTQTYALFGIVMGGKGGTLKNLVAYTPYDDFGFEKNQADLAFRAENIIKLLHDFVEMRKDHPEISGGSLTRVRYTASPFYNKKNSVVKGKTLLVDERSLEQQTGGVYGGKKKMSKEDFRKNYKGKVKFVNTAEYTEALETNNPDYACFMPIYNRKKYLFVIDCETGSLCYELYATSGLFYSARDLKAMNKAIGM